MTRTPQLTQLVIPIRSAFAALLFATCSALPAAAVDDQTPEQQQLEQLESEDSARESLMSDVRKYLKRIEERETAQGAYAPGLSEDLLGLALALQRNGDHIQAVEIFKRGVHLSRVTEGLYSRNQLALLKGEIASHIALGQYEVADERQRYLYRVQAKTLSDVTRGQALMQHALWQRRAYEAGLGEQPFSRLINMWSLYRLALTEFAEVEGESSPMLLPPLYGMLRAQYLISGFVGEMSNGRFRTGGVYGDEESQQIGYGSQSLKQGKAVLRAIYDIETAQPDFGLRDSAELLLMMADWQLWHGKRNDAFEAYGRLYGELADGEAAQAIREALFSTPTPLPALAGVRALPQPVAQEEGRLLLEFGVTERGRVVDLERVDKHPQNDELADDVMSRLRRTPFRPRIDDGLPVNTEGLRWAYDTRLW